jgi:hypothetical protein
MENVIGKFIEYLAQAIEKNKKNEDRHSLEYRLGKNEAYSEALLMMTKGLISESHDISKRMKETITDNNKNN